MTRAAYGVVEGRIAASVLHVDLGAMGNEVLDGISMCGIVQGGPCIWVYDINVGAGLRYSTY